jgi:hypothetical protein
MIAQNSSQLAHGICEARQKQHEFTVEHLLLAMLDNQPPDVLRACGVDLELRHVWAISLPSTPRLRAPTRTRSPRRIPARDPAPSCDAVLGQKVTGANVLVALRRRTRMRCIS